MSREQTLREMVLSSVADDYESFELIEEQVARWAGDAKMDFTANELAEHLGDLIRDGLIRAYVLSPRPPHSAVAEFSPKRLAELWYLATPEGTKVVKVQEG
jgi:hypothetical protein